MMQFTKRNMTRAAIVLLCGAKLALPALAENHGDDRHSLTDDHSRCDNHEQEPTLTSILSELHLTATQTAQVTDIIAQAGVKILALRSNTTLSHKAFNQQMKTLTGTAISQIKTLLTEEQEEEFEDVKEQLLDWMSETDLFPKARPVLGT